MKKAKEYVSMLEREYEKLRNDYLLEHGYVEKEVCEKVLQRADPAGALTTDRGCKPSIPSSSEQRNLCNGKSDA